MKILIFGGTGFLGKNLTEYLLGKHYNIGLYVRPSALRQEFVYEKKNFLEMDLKVGEFQKENNF